ncbi:hypothetical protein [Arthrobacter sp.]|uniref:hypothetical protein n=1 Tax=Arthrobacter sp. TaxID=1667 RepID=UPI003A8FF6AB
MQLPELSCLTAAEGIGGLLVPSRSPTYLRATAALNKWAFFEEMGTMTSCGGLPETLSDPLRHRVAVF